jgi:glycosyltransferase involved in cell wall biosynthesis
MDTQVKPLVSVVVPVYKVEKYIARCIESILAQTYRNLELILVDDGSPDNSGAICDAYAAIDGRIRVIHTSNNGASHARNTGMKSAVGEFLVFIDSDDWVEPEHIALLLPVGNEDFVYCGYNTLVQGKKISDYSFDTQVVSREQWSDDFAIFWKKYTMWSMCRGCYRIELIRSSQLVLNQDMTVGEDEQFNLRYVDR